MNTFYNLLARLPGGPMQHYLVLIVITATFGFFGPADLAWIISQSVGIVAGLLFLILCVLNLNQSGIKIRNMLLWRLFAMISVPMAAMLYLNLYLFAGNINHLFLTIIGLMAIAALLSTASPWTKQIKGWQDERFTHEPDAVMGG